MAWGPLPLQMDRFSACALRDRVSGAWLKQPVEAVKPVCGGVRSLPKRLIFTPPSCVGETGASIGNCLPTFGGCSRRRLSTAHQLI